jgi:hypothetical protein
MDKKYGVYICEGCGLGESLDIEKLCDVPKEEGLAVKTCPILCGKEGVELLKKDIAGEGVNTLVIAACLWSGSTLENRWYGPIPGPSIRLLPKNKKMMTNLSITFR